MSYKIQYNKQFENFKNILLNIKSIFSQNSQTIHLARNELKIIEIENISTVVKAFRVPNVLNQFVYAYLRKSKAYKAFHNATILHDLHVSTPEPIGYIEFFKFALLKESFFISKEFKYDFTIAHIRDEQPEYKKNVLEDFAEFTYYIHTKGVWHVDYSGGNILVKKDGDKYLFSLVDINRMKFRTISNYEGLENFNKLWFNEEDLTTIAKAYSKLASLDENRAIDEILMQDKKLKDKVLLKRKLRGVRN
ncbi:hypothetical protein HUE87_03030 [Candidatus Sulfurimonas marisnigri]|uniref:Protein kinase domain-containing protein n=1 Tax=Candidatus Sulfurimonas marisnigri TaxID=2740405 RepID=A0A7S7RR05_9BACT|nr:lipopolysaccharide kinase InaA family protein [Candidatus Sulfurimonas marisnigri]QOY55226.1 hypothetical protein HUE87_03030 [Candidatus Sulfurimonas marisnigri]